MPAHIHHNFKLRVQPTKHDRMALSHFLSLYRNPNMKLSSLATFLSLASSAAAFSVNNASPKTTQLSAKACQDDVAMDRRKMFLSTSFAAVSTFGVAAQSASADEGLSLLDQFGSDPKKISQQAKPEPVAPAKATAKSESTIEPNLRSNYYYPTNKKRYLPRIKKCNDAIPLAAEAIGTAEWETAEQFVDKIADDTILPLKLYTSSLLGGGTNVKVSFTKDMSKAADDFEKAQKTLSKAIKKRDQTASSRALEDLSAALQAYREAGRLTGPDAGGDIPSVDEIRRSACRVQGRTFEQKVRARDQRLADAMANVGN